MKQNFSTKRLKNGKLELLLAASITAGAVVWGVFAQENAHRNAQVPVSGTFQWSMAPLVDASVPILPKNKKPIVEISSPIAGPPPTNPMREVATAGKFKGTLIYTPSLQIGKPRAQQYWVFHSFTGNTFPREQVATSIHYAGDADGRVWDPQLSPDGKILLFKLALSPFKR